MVWVLVWVLGEAPLWPETEIRVFDGWMDGEHMDTQDTGRLRTPTHTYALTPYTHTLSLAHSKDRHASTYTAIPAGWNLCLTLPRAAGTVQLPRPSGYGTASMLSCKCKCNCNAQASSPHVSMLNMPIPARAAATPSPPPTSISGRVSAVGTDISHARLLCPLSHRNQAQRGDAPSCDERGDNTPTTPLLVENICN